MHDDGSRDTAEILFYCVVSDNETCFRTPRLDFFLSIHFQVNKCQGFKLISTLMGR